MVSGTIRTNIKGVAMNEYRVKWEIDIEAESEEDAAKIAFDIQNEPEHIATIFEVLQHNMNEDGTKTIDISDL